MTTRSRATLLTTALFAAFLAAEAVGDDQGTKITLSNGRISLVAPGGWEQKEPATRIVEYEFRVPPAEGDKRAGRVTIMGAGGSVEQNVARWGAQFKGGNGAPANVKQDKKMGDGVTTHVIDIRGDYTDTFRPSESGPNFRLLGAIIVTEAGQYFVKVVGPEKTIAANEEGFNKLVESVKVK